ncbi:urea transporter [Zobellella maritima]|uniref:urea transporter n=1 Tax=Zobellella maritima TaxID=2059725 RepID=UPI000E3060FC|nr:urea transporter [Zobellella maritima]
MGLLSAVLAGISQIYFINRPLPGLLITLAVAWVSPYMALVMLLATASATLTAHRLKFDAQPLAEGVYGYNAALVGLALTLFAPDTVWVPLIAVVLGCVSCLVYFLLRKLGNIPWYTLPFNLLILPWLYWSGQRLADEVPGGYQFILSAVGQVVFLPDTLPAVLLCIALLTAGIGMLGWALAGGLLASLVALGLLVNPDYMNFGLTGYNGVLAALAMFWQRSRFGWSLIAALLAGGMTAAMLRLGLPMLTMPFILSCWLCLLAQWLAGNKCQPTPPKIRI